MFNSVVLDVVIGLIFIYLLYSLLASILSEIAATAMSLRARNLKEAIDRMLTDDKKYGWLRRLLDSMNILKNPKNPVVNTFYDHPEIKYMGSSGAYKNPSNFKAASFSKALTELLAGTDPFDKEGLKTNLKRDKIEFGVKQKKQAENADDIKKPDKSAFRKLILWFRHWAWKNTQDEDKKVNPVLEPETAGYIRNLWNESQGDIEKFKLLLEGWFEKTMVHTLEWYKRKYGG